MFGDYQARKLEVTAGSQHQGYRRLVVKKIQTIAMGQIKQVFAYITGE